jgi:hypothetical protein
MRIYAEFGSNLRRILVEEIHEVDFALFLIGCGMILEEMGDAERIAELIEAVGLEGYLSPGLEGFTSLIGVGEDHDLVVYQGGQQFVLEHLEATTGEPYIVREELGEDDCGFL